MAKNKLSGLLNQSYQKGYNQGLADGQYIMMHIIQIALHETFGFGNSNREKWKALDAAIDKKVDYITARINEGEAEMGFEKLVEGMRIARGDEVGDKVEQLYKEVLYSFNKE